MNKYLLLTLIIFIARFSCSQTYVKMSKQNGVYTMPCTVNGLPLKFIFDTGASNVSISLTEAMFMIKNGYLKVNDVGENEYYKLANGEISKGTKINLTTVKIEDIILKNIEASVVHELNAPLLLGQSALNRFKSITFDYVTNTLVLNKSESEENQYKLTYNTDLICLERNIYYKPDDAIIIDKVTIDGSNTDKKNVSFIKFTNKTGYQLKYVELEFSILNSTMMEIWKSTIIVETTIKNMEYFEYKLEKPILIRENEKFVLSVNDWDIKM